MKKLLLVSANQMKSPYPVYPLGVSYLHTYLEKHLKDMDVKIFDFILHDFADYENILKTYQPDYVGLSIRNVDDVNITVQQSFINHYKKIVEYIRKYSDAVVIAGGSGYSIYPKQMYEFIKPDYGIYGEGEARFCELLQALESNNDYSQISNLVYRHNGQLFFNKNEQSLKSIDVCFDDKILDYYWQHSGMLNVQTKRGCPFKCIYCTYPIIEGHKVRTLNASVIADTLEDLSRNRGINYIFFTDSIFNIDNAFNYELADIIIRKKLDIQWGAYFNFCNIDEKLLSYMQKAGLKHIEFGTDTLSESMLKNYNKPFKVSDIMHISDICARLGIDYAHFLILAGYGETEATINETFNNARLLEKTVFFPFIGLRIYPGTKLHEIALNEGKINAADDLLRPTYYISDKVDTSLFKAKAKETGKRWIFPEDDLTAIMQKMRARNKKGPLWEFLIQ